MTTWRRPVGCDTSSCPELTPRDGWPGEILVRSSDRPHGVAILTTDELRDLATAVQRGDFAALLGEVPTPA